MTKARKMGRNARSGRFVPLVQARRRKATSTVETVGVPKKRPATMPGFVLVGRSQALTAPPPGGRLHVYLDRAELDRKQIDGEVIIDVVVHTKR